MSFRDQGIRLASVYDTFCNWSRRTTPFGELLFNSSLRQDRGPDADDGLIYRLKHWPSLPDSYKTANVYRVLSLMSNRRVNRNWIQVHSKLPAEQLDRLLRRLVDNGALEVIDASKFPPAAKQGR